MNNDWSDLLIKWKDIPKIDIQKTVFEIAGIESKEEVSNDVLKFYFSSDKEHGLHDLLFKSLLEELKELSGDRFEGKSFKDIVAHREVTTGSRNRIDLVIKTRGYIIGIESKLYSGLHNDLSDYGKHLDQSKKDNQTVYKVVLSLHKLNKDEDKKKIENNYFINITYTDLFRRIRSNIGDYINNSNDRYVRILLEYIETIENLTGANMANQEMDNFFQQHKGDLDDLIDKYEDYQERINKKINDLEKWMPNDSDKVKLKLTYDKRRVDRDDYLTYDYLINGHKVQIYAGITPDGWFISLYGKNKSNINQLIQDKRLQNNEIKTDNHYDFIIYENSEINAIEATGEKLLELLQVLEAIKAET